MESGVGQRCLGVAFALPSVSDWRSSLSSEDKGWRFFFSAARTGKSPSSGRSRFFSSTKVELEDPHLHCLWRFSSSLVPDVSDDCGGELVHLPNFLHLVLADFRRNLKIRPHSCGSFLVLDVSSLEACAQEVYHPRGIRSLG